MKKIHIINGPNINLLGIREPNVYGTKTFEDYLYLLQEEFSTITITYYQSNVEGELVDEIQKVGFDSNFLGIILNAAAYSHTSLAIADAVAAIKLPTIEVHISNIYAREAFRHNSFISAKAKGVICGFGLDGYKLAIQNLLQTNTP